MSLIYETLTGSKVTKYFMPVCHILLVTYYTGRVMLTCYSELCHQNTEQGKKGEYCGFMKYIDKMLAILLLISFRVIISHHPWISVC